MGTVVVAEFADPSALLDGVRTLREEGWRHIDAHSPYPVHGISDALGLRRSPLPNLVLVGAAAGGSLGYFLQWFANAVDYPINVGGRPAHAAPSFVPITFELAVLSGALCTVIGLLLIAGLPRLYHPVFDAAPFHRASIDQFWISVVCEGVDAQRLVERLTQLGARAIQTVEARS